ncbi:unnamed protein product [Sympodiomycopsis kandeliae]
MRLPRRSPFHNAQQEIHHLYNLFYPPHGHLSADEAHHAREQGVNLVQEVYMVKGGCPIAMECTASLVSCILLDEQLQSLSKGGKLSIQSQLSLRQTLSLSLIRLVNSLSDSLQSGPYARSIANIAQQQLGMPQWFVEFRHRATHEELPSLEICRSVVGAALHWLEGVFWRPMLMKLAVEQEYVQRDTTSASSSSDKQWWQNQQQHPSDAANILLSGPSDDTYFRSPAELVQASIPSLDPILKAYKRVAKLIARDESLRGPSRAELTALYSETDAWIASQDQEVQDLLQRQQHTLASQEDQSSSEQSASSKVLYHLFEHLLQPGGFIPLSKAKRAKRQSSLPTEVLRTWSPLLIHLIREWDNVGDTLMKAINDVILNDNQLFLSDKSYRYTILAWIQYLLTPSADDDLHHHLQNTFHSNKALQRLVTQSLYFLPSTSSSSKYKIIHAHISNLITHFSDTRQQTKYTQILDLFSSPCTDTGDDEEEEEMLKGFEDMDRSPQSQAVQQDEEMMREMKRRYDEVVEMLGASVSGDDCQESDDVAEQEQSERMDTQEDNHHRTEEEEEEEEEIDLPSGWSRPSQSQWKPAPIGCHWQGDQGEWTLKIPFVHTTV